MAFDNNKLTGILVLEVSQTQSSSGTVLALGPDSDPAVWSIGDPPPPLSISSFNLGLINSTL